MYLYMIRQCEYKRRYDPNIGKYVYQHVYDGTIQTGSGVFSSLANFGRKLLGKKTITDVANKAAKKASEQAITTVGEHSGRKAGQQIINLLQKSEKKTMVQPLSVKPTTQLDEFDRNLAVERLLARGGGVKKRR